MTDDTVNHKKTQKRRRDPEGTREAILEVAGKLLGKDGPEGLSVSQVAQLAGVNRGTAYHHFQTREQLLAATTQWVSEKLYREVFYNIPEGEERDVRLEPNIVIEKLVMFAMKNPEFGRVWLFEILNSKEPASDPFWSRFCSRIENFMESEYAEPGVDTEVHAVLMLVGTFLWPVWASSHAKTESEQLKMAKRFSQEIMRLNLHGTIREEKYSELLNTAKDEFDGKKFSK